MNLLFATINNRRNTSVFSKKDINIYQPSYYANNNPYNIINIALNNAIDKIGKLNQEIQNASIEFRDIKLNDHFSYSKKVADNNIIQSSKLRPYLQ